ncbi:hypothetical protein STENM327S_00705 [Streptomyces tendae]
MHPDSFGIRMVLVWPAAGPGMDASGAGVGGLPPAGQAWKVPFSSTQPF